MRTSRSLFNTCRVAAVGLMTTVQCMAFSAGHGTQIGFVSSRAFLSHSGVFPGQVVDGLTVSRKGARFASALRLKASRSDDESNRIMRDQAIGFLASEPFTEVSEGAGLENQLRKAMKEAEAAEARAEAIRSARSQMRKKTRGAGSSRGNGLSSMLDPMAMAMVESQSDYVRRCPVKDIQEAMELTRCGVMLAFSKLEPRTLLGAAMIMYAISVLQISQ
mmetsp:Transcript_52758/g.107632  ORF Transcript_52758/g.107632 Transcript_52758/m.107632 type:complete len:219 (+) Transcript_52758:144-800(+)|eukprot:CAMPEP_0181301670 /NCGR_PEP_ID=MMETSP1101-20121128/7551_1 /TAXON_ID=46948 /ORGANISM="Rhodomonas abbreviata, Strain Caron Lab Isolate" /LENGTH=218 /DNA_ID=CAMNT_0023406997 /DNA_START=144 /DNA_END=800 /DNA_ORIENTATION=-